MGGMPQNQKRLGVDDRLFHAFDRKKISRKIF
jgi:hypothetical protein